MTCRLSFAVSARRNCGDGMLAPVEFVADKDDRAEDRAAGGDGLAASGVIGRAMPQDDMLGLPRR